MSSNSSSGPLSSSNTSTPVVSFPKSEGDASYWPVTGSASYVLHRDGRKHYYRAISPGEEKYENWLFKIAKGMEEALQWPEQDDYQLQLPRGYRMFEADRLNYDNRCLVPRKHSDKYLYGSPYGRFRSPAEFIPHALWLWTDATLDHSNCLCQYQKKTSYQHVSNRPPSVGTGDMDTRRMSSNMCPSDMLPSAEVIPTTTEVEKQKPRKRQLGNSCPSGILSSFKAVPCRVRRGELVFCSLPYPIQGKGQEGQISAWPAVLLDNGTSQKHPFGETYLYKLWFLGLTSISSIPEEYVLPYQSYSQSHHTTIQKAAYPHSSRFLEGNTNFSPWLSSGDLVLSNVAGHYLMGLQIASRLSMTWSLNSEECPPGSVSKSSPLPLFYRPAENSPCSEDLNVKGIWWGTEYISVSDLVLLRLPRASFHEPALMNVSVVLPPLHCSKSDPTSTDLELFHFTAGPVLMLIYKIFVEELEGEDGTARREARASGMLFEIADIEGRRIFQDTSLGSYFLPNAPERRWFRPILLDGYVADISLECIGRRYHENHSILTDDIGFMLPEFFVMEDRNTTIKESAKQAWEDVQQYFKNV
ncbi:hypothetical protein VKT23_013347 [Stygiomarasmius scandens]|uniref:Cryptic loci regulator 2 N-terminal domain-containing protein n=1 Tax=Marasmiellus scandens TaxID=2682957 RepID=A0ABR1J365_9AGAR